jgi:hypothetical protein
MRHVTFPLFLAVVVAALGLPASPARAQAERSDEDTKKSKENLRRIGMAMHEYHKTHGHLPPFAIHDEKGRPLLSWRVALLPYLKEHELQNAFNYDQAWDSPNNKALVKKMPAVYRLPGAKDQDDKGMTYYRVFTGPGTGFESKDGHTFRDFTDGTSCTILGVEAATATEWTKPDELVYVANQPIRNVGGLFQNGFWALYCDASVRHIRNAFDQKRMHMRIVRNDGDALPYIEGEP